MGPSEPLRGGARWARAASIGSPTKSCGTPGAAQHVPGGQGVDHRKAMGTGSLSPATELQHVINACDEKSRWGADVVHDHPLVGPLYGGNLGLPSSRPTTVRSTASWATSIRVVGQWVPVGHLSLPGFHLHEAGAWRDPPRGRRGKLPSGEATVTTP
jgi:hypothetical protein